MRTGYRLALGIAALTVAAAMVLLVVELTASGRDTGAYGEVPVPGRDSVSLPAGEVIVYYGERIGDDEDARLTVPPDLRLWVRTTRGQLLGGTAYRFDQLTDGHYLRRSIAKLKVPEAGPYEAVTPTRTPGAVDPVISFGREGSRNFGYLLFVLSGGLLLTAILGGGTTLVARRQRSAQP
jgi:hypothetical protein